MSAIQLRIKKYRLYRLKKILFDRVEVKQITRKSEDGCTFFNRICVNIKLFPREQFHLTTLRL